MMPATSRNTILSPLQPQSLQPQPGTGFPLFSPLPPPTYSKSLAVQQASSDFQHAIQTVRQQTTQSSGRERQRSPEDGPGQPAIAAGQPVNFTWAAPPSRGIGNAVTHLHPLERLDPIDRPRSQILLLESNTGQRFAAKFSDDFSILQDEYLAAEKIQARMAANPLVRQIYGLINICIDGKTRPALLMDHVPGLDGFWLQPKLLEYRLRGILSNQDLYLVSQVIALDVLRALQALDGAGFTHVDIKADNLVVNTHGRCVLIDLESCIPTGAHSDLGCYVTPEMHNGQACDSRTGVFQLGETLKKLAQRTGMNITGYQPFQNMLKYTLGDISTRLYPSMMRNRSFFDLSRNYGNESRGRHILSLIALGQPITRTMLGRFPPCPPVHVGRVLTTSSHWPS